MGETVADRDRLLEVLATMDPHPESVPINTLVAAKGTPLADRPPIDPPDLVRMVAAARARLTREAQTLRFLAGANSIFYGDKLLTTANNDAENDRDLIAAPGLEFAGVEGAGAAE